MLVNHVQPAKPVQVAPVLAPAVQQAKRVKQAVPVAPSVAVDCMHPVDPVLARDAHLVLLVVLALDPVLLVALDTTVRRMHLLAHLVQWAPAIPLVVASVLSVLQANSTTRRAAFAVDVHRVLLPHPTAPSV